MIFRICEAIIFVLALDRAITSSYKESIVCSGLRGVVLSV